MQDEDVRNNDIKSRNRCPARRKLDHWFHNRQECRQLMVQKRRAAEKKMKDDQIELEKENDNSGKPGCSERQAKEENEKGSLFQ